MEGGGGARNDAIERKCGSIYVGTGRFSNSENKIRMTDGAFQRPW